MTATTMDVATRCGYVRRILAVAPDASALFSFARLADLDPHGWLQQSDRPWCIAEEIVHRATIGRPKWNVDRMEALLIDVEAMSSGASAR